MTHTTKINGYLIRCRITSEGRCIPMADDILRAVGLELLDPELERFYSMLMEVDTKDFLRWVCYVCDLNYETAREKVKHYFILDSGIRIKYGQTDEIRTEELQTARDHISCVEETHYFSYDEVGEMLTEEGFNIKIITNE